MCGILGLSFSIQRGDFSPLLPLIPQAEGPPHVGHVQLLIQSIYLQLPSISGNQLHQHPEDVPCCGEKEPT
jgi:hypothetical protein